MANQRKAGQKLVGAFVSSEEKNIVKREREKLGMTEADYVRHRLGLKPTGNPSTHQNGTQNISSVKRRIVR